MRRAYGWLFAVLLLLSLCLPCMGAQSVAPAHQTYKTYRDIPGVTPGEMAAIEALHKKGRRFFYGMNFSTEAFSVGDGAAGGFAALFCKELSALFDMPFELWICSWDELIAGLDGRTIDFTGELTSTPERLKKYFMTEPIAERSIKIFTNKNAESLASLAADRKLRFAFLDGSTSPGYIRESSEYEFDPTFVKDYPQVAELLRSGRVDAFFEENSAEAALGAWDFIKVQDYFPIIYAPVSFSTANPELAPIVSVIDKYLKNGGIYRLSELYRDGRHQYLHYKLFTQMTPEEKAYVNRHTSPQTPVPILAEFDNYPACFYNERDKEFQGIAIDVLEQVTELTGLTFKPVNDKNDLWVDLLRMLEDGSAAMLSELVPSNERKGHYIWSKEPYAVDHYALLSRADHEDIDINQILYVKVGLIRGSAYEEVFRQWFPHNTNTAIYLSNDDAFAALEKGEVDFVMATQNLLLSITNYLEKPGFKANIVFDRSYNSLFGFNKNETVLRDIVSKTQALLDTNTIAQRWMRKTFDYRAKMAAAQIPYVMGFAFLMVLGMASVSALLIKNRKISKNLEDTVVQRTHELQVQTKAAQVASRAKSEFLARMSHEIRTPLNAIVGMTRIARGSARDPEKVLRAVGQIDAASSHLLGIVNDVLDMSKIESGKFEIAHEPFALSQAMQEVYSIVAQRCKEKEIRLATSFSGLDGIWVLGDKLRVKQVLINLLGNAVKFTDRGGRIDFQIDVEEDTDREIVLTFTVADNGIGMTPDQMSRLFIPFEQADSSIAVLHGGTGLGLAISQKLTEQMGGRIAAASELGVGSAFSFSLRLPKTDADAGLVELPADRKLDLAGKRILLAEDVEINRTILLELLADTHVTIDEAVDGLHAVETFQNAPLGHYDLIFMDVQMPNLSGYEATERIRALDRPDAAAIPIVAMTANAYKEDVDRALACGMNGHLAKPLDIDAVMRCLAETLLKD